MRFYRIRFHPHIPDWEREALAFSPLEIPREDLDVSVCWVNYRGEFVLPLENVLSAEEIVKNDLEVGVYKRYTLETLRNFLQEIFINIGINGIEWSCMKKLECN